MSQAAAPRRVVLLAGDEKSAVEAVLKEYAPGEASGTRLHAELRSQALDNPGRLLAAEWRGERGWERFMWCRA
jgi:hypothetical protein